MSTWEQRMAKRAKTAALKRKLRQNLEGNKDPVENTLTASLAFCSEPVTAEHWAAWFEEEEGPSVVGEDSVS